MPQTFATIKLAIENDELDSTIIELIKQNPEVASEKHGGDTLLNLVREKLFTQLPTETLCQSVSHGFSPQAVIDTYLTKLKVIRDIATYLLRAGAVPNESDMLYFQLVLSRFTDQTAFSTDSFIYHKFVRRTTPSYFVNILNDFKELTNEFIKKGFHYKAPDEYPYNPITSRMKAEELEAYIQTVKDNFRQKVCSGNNNTFATIKLAIENNELDQTHVELIKQNPEVASEKHRGDTLLSLVCNKLFTQLPTEILCQSVKHGVSFNNPRGSMDACLKKLKVLRDIATHLLRAGAVPNESDMLYFRVILSRFTDQTALSPSYFVNVLNDFKELTNEFIKKGFNYKAPGEYPVNPVTSRMKAEELEAYIQVVKKDYTQEICSSTKNSLN